MDAIIIRQHHILGPNTMPIGLGVSSLVSRISGRPPDGGETRERKRLNGVRGANDRGRPQNTLALINRGANVRGRPPSMFRNPFRGEKAETHVALIGGGTP